MSRRTVTGRARAAAEAVRGRHARRARRLSEDLRRARSRADRVRIRPWEYRLPRVVVLAVAEASGWRPEGGPRSQVEYWPWRSPMGFVAAAPTGVGTR